MASALERRAGEERGAQTHIEGLHAGRLDEAFGAAAEPGTVPIRAAWGAKAGQLGKRRARKAGMATHYSSCEPKIAIIARRLEHALPTRAIVSSSSWCGSMRTVGSGWAVSKSQMKNSSLRNLGRTARYSGCERSRVRQRSLWTDFVVVEEEERRTNVDNHRTEEERSPATSVSCSSRGALSAIVSRTAAVLARKPSIARTRRAGRWTSWLTKRTTLRLVHGPPKTSSSRGRSMPASEKRCIASARHQYALVVA